MEEKNLSSVKITLHGFLKEYIQGKESWEVSIRDITSLRELLTGAGIPLQFVGLTIKNGIPVSLDDEISPGDTVSVFSLVIGG